jgi:hypothetical protein
VFSYALTAGVLGVVLVKVVTALLNGKFEKGATFHALNGLLFDHKDQLVSGVFQRLFVLFVFVIFLSIYFYFISFV